MQVKGRVAFASPLARKAPSGKAVRKKKMPPTDAGFHKIRWHINKISRKQGIYVGGKDVSRKKVTPDTECLKIFHFTKSRCAKKKNATNQGGSASVWWHKGYVRVAYAVKKSF